MLKSKVICHKMDAPRGSTPHYINLFYHYRHEVPRAVKLKQTERRIMGAQGKLLFNGHKVSAMKYEKSSGDE